MNHVTDDSYDKSLLKECCFH